jgi:HSP20 family protein
MLPVMRKRVYTPGYLNNYFGRDLLTNFFSDGADYTVPAVNIKENENGFSIEVAAPGLNKEDFNIKVEKDVLTISSEMKDSKEESSENYMKREFGFQAFSRSFSIPESINQDKISASHKNGILILELPKMDEAKMKKTKTIKIA